MAFGLFGDTSAEGFERSCYTQGAMVFTIFPGPPASIRELRHIGAQVDFLAGVTGRGTKVFLSQSLLAVPFPLLVIRRAMDCRLTLRLVLHGLTKRGINPVSVLGRVAWNFAPTEDTGTTGSCGDALADSIPDPDPNDGDNEVEARSEIHTGMELRERVQDKLFQEQFLSQLALALAQAVSHMSCPGSRTRQAASPTAPSLDKSQPDIGGNPGRIDGLI
ncbi:hypothetical protein BDZ97DRAFT_2057371 [Flammula alnicola]|nr:hypothetical protein BDZ97DRAFT_2057371 [Flammula alnicola]